MLKQKIKNRVGSLLPIIVMVLALSGSTLYPGLASADSYGQQIQALQQQNAQNQQAVDQLALQASSYQDAINKLDAQINNLQQAIVANQKQSNKLQAQIDAQEKELDHQRQVLGENIKTMYLEGQTSTLEILASSNNISDFVNKETYRNTVQNQIRNTLEKIKDLKQQLKSKQQKVQQLIKTQQDERNQLASAEYKQSQMLTYNQQQQADYTQKTRSNQDKINRLIAQQLSANNSSSGGYRFLRFPGNVTPHNINVDDYPYRDAGFSMQLGPCSDYDYYPDSPDRWGYCTRQCVSYAAWAVERSGRAAPEGYGNAKDWGSTHGSQYVVSSPKPGDVAISTTGTWGHAMYVEEVSGNLIHVSEYNQQVDGRYRNDRWIPYR